MAGYLIKDTTREEREKIVEEALGNISASCDGCAARTADMYQAYIEGQMEIRDINMQYNARYVRGDIDKPEREGCGVI
ncbi:MAG: purine biosynthesis protein PurH [Lachnospiraceae bacterium]|nr:purine biosynthesis protein PurH [Lachnospiraceae bacterium]